MAEISRILPVQLERIMERFKIKRSDIVEITGISEATLSRAFSGQADSIRISYWEPLLMRYNISANWFFFDIGPMRLASEPTQNRFRQITTDLKSKLEELDEILPDIIG